MNQAMIWKKRYNGLYLLMGQVTVGKVFHTYSRRREGVWAYRTVSMLPGIDADFDFATEDEAREKLEAITKQWFWAVGCPIQV